MTPTASVSAAQVAHVFRRWIPGVGPKKLHRLLYLAQGHHLARSGKPLFAEPVAAWDAGPVVPALWIAESNANTATEDPELGENELSIIYFVTSRYGRLTNPDLERLTRTQGPWQRASEHRRPGESAIIENEWMAEFFRHDLDDERFPVDTAVRAAAVAAAAQRRIKPADVEAIKQPRSQQSAPTAAHGP